LTCRRVAGSVARLLLTAALQGDFMDEIAEFICKEWPAVRAELLLHPACRRCSPQITMDAISLVDKEKEKGKG
jgi:hypothetical protein